MCGILIQFSATQNADTSLFKKSLDIMSHRGPDGSGIVFEKEDTYLFKQQDNVTGYSRILLGHRRLSIIDLATGSQPMVDSTGNYALTFNGEIFNYKQLHADLLNKYNIQFKTTSDSEVLLYGLIKEGASFLNKCNGMWAFGFYSIKDKELFISRDRYGIKPLYYMQIGASIIASSEIKPLLQFTKSSINNSITDFYIKTGISDFSDETFFNNIKQLHPGHNLTVCSKGDTVHLDISQWYDIYKKKYEYTDTQDCESAYRDLINDSVKLRLESDVEVGALLSGGIDSSIVVGVAANFFNQSKIKTFSGISENKNYDESFWIDAVVKKHQHIINTKTNLESEISAGEIDEVILTQESPFSTSSIISQNRLFRTIAPFGIKVVLDGQGSDEINLGYDKYFGYALKQMLGQGKLSDAIAYTKDLFSYQTNMHGIMHVANALLPNFITSILRSAKGVSSYKDINEMIYLSKNMPLFDFEKLIIQKMLLPIHLRYLDRNSMKYSIEARSPFLDHRLVEFALSMPANQRLTKGRRKGFLLHTMKDILPIEVYERKSKIGFKSDDALILKRVGSKESTFRAFTTQRWKQLFFEA